MPAPFSIANEETHAVLWTCDINGNVTQVGSQTVQGNLIVAGTTTQSGNQTINGNEQINGTLGVSGLITPSSGVNMPGISAPGTPGTSNVLYADTVFRASSINPSGEILTLEGNVQAQTSTVTVANTAAATALTSYTVPANDIVAGAIYRVTGFGVYSWTGTPTLVLSLVWGGAAGTVLAAIPAVTLGTAQTNATFSYSGLLIARSTTSFWSELEVKLGTTSAADLANVYVATPTTATAVTSTTSNALVVAATWGTASASNTISLNGGMVERVA